MDIDKMIEELQSLQKAWYKKVIWANKDWTDGGCFLKVDPTEDDKWEVGEVVITVSHEKFDQD